MSFDKTKIRSKRPIVRIALVFVVITLLVGLFPQTSVGAVTCKFKHKVLQGETLIYIANLYGVGWEVVAEANKLNPPYTLIEGQVLCIPEGEKPAGTTDDDDEKNPATLQIVPGMNSVLVSVENFAKKTSYFVRVSPTGGAATQKVGFFTTNKEGDFTGWFRLPKYMSRTPKMTVCVKNAWTDAVSCVKYDDIFVFMPPLVGGCSAKEGR